MTNAVATARLLRPYRRRAFLPGPLWEWEGFRLKTYCIHLADAAPPGAAVKVAAEREARARLPQAAAAEGEAHGLGYVILHEGEQGIWLLMQWWAHGDICCQRLSRAAPGTAGFEAVDARPLMACVWELRVIEHERAAWIDAMLTPAPDPERYLTDCLAAGPY